MAWDLSCPDWFERLQTGRSLVPDLPHLDRAEGDRAVGIFNALRLADVEGSPRLGPALPGDPPGMGSDAVADWFRDMVRALFGSLDRSTRHRIIREIFCLVGKKNSKTTYGALLMLTALLMNVRPSAPFIMTAPVQDVTDIAFGAAVGAIELDDVLKRKFHVRDHVRTIVHRETKAELQIMTFDPSVLTGQLLAGALIDEVHICARMSRADRALRQLRGGMIAFPEAFLVMLTTQSEDPPQGIMAAELAKARRIRDGKQTGNMLPLLYEFPLELQKQREYWQDPKHWPMVTPNAGRSVHVARLIEEFDAARSTSEAELRGWASQHLNVEIGVALASDRWAGAAHWEKAGDPGVTLDAIMERCEVITLGIDGGGLDDLLGASAIGRDRETQDWLSWSRAWCHRGVLDLRKDIASKLLDLERDGDLVIVEDDSTSDVEELAEIAGRIHRSGLLDKVGVDPAGIGAIVDALIAEEIEVDQIVGISQGWKMAGAIKTTERKIAARSLRHGSRRLMAWCVGNAKVEPRGNAIVITKQISGTAKIDPLMALFNAVALMSMNPQAKAMPGVIVLG